jgi:hypothetical protein
MKKQGWHKNKELHSLAARGVKTCPTCGAIREWNEGNKQIMLFNSKEAAEYVIRKLHDSGLNWRGGYVGGGYEIQIIGESHTHKDSKQILMEQIKRDFEGKPCITCNHPLHAKQIGEWCGVECSNCDEFQISDELYPVSLKNKRTDWSKMEFEIKPNQGKYYIYGGLNGARDLFEIRDTPELANKEVKQLKLWFSNYKEDLNEK